MLTHLYLKNFVIAEELDVELKPGMTVVTGETGAGKSLLVDALEIVLGGRAENAIVGHNADRCEIQALFDLRDLPQATAWLVAHALYNDDECFVRRYINSDGRSRSFINGHAVPLQLVRELGNFFVTIYGQHAHQQLLQRETQRKLLDAYAGHATLLAEVADIYQQWRKIQLELSSLQTKLQNREAQCELLEYQIRELDTLGYVENELETLVKEHKLLANTEQILEQCQTAFELLAENNNQNVLSLLNKTQTALITLKSKDNRLDTTLDLLAQSTIQIQEAADELRHYLDQVELNPERLLYLEQRLNTIHDLARKHRVSPEQLPQVHEQLQQELASLSHSTDKLIALQQKLDQLATNYNTRAKTLTASREKAANKLSQQVMKRMNSLGMQEAQFAIRFQSTDVYTAEGVEQVEFHVNTNPGNPLRPLNKIASGGELSRISLAIQVIIAEHYTIPTLVFDEVDVGIGGSTAATVGNLLQTVAKNAQIICITHLAQVAAYGQQHFQVKKQSNNTETIATVHLLNNEEKTQEIARMLGGITVTTQTLAHAREMIEMV